MSISTLLRRLLRDRVFAGSLAALAAVTLISVTAAGGGGPARTYGPYAGATATSTTAPSATAVPTAQPWEQLLDARRVLDLAALAGALATYHQRYGNYPSTGGATAPVCHASTGAGCKLSAVSGALPYGDGTYDYLYRSDGATFTLYTRLQTPVTPDGCGGDRPEALAGVPVYCRSELGGP